MDSATSVSAVSNGGSVGAFGRLAVDGARRSLWTPATRSWHLYPSTPFGECKVSSGNGEDVRCSFSSFIYLLVVSRSTLPRMIFVQCRVLAQATAPSFFAKLLRANHSGSHGSVRTSMSSPLLPLSARGVASRPRVLLQRMPPRGRETYAQLHGGRGDAGQATTGVASSRRLQAVERRMQASLTEAARYVRRGLRPPTRREPRADARCTRRRALAGAGGPS